MSLEDRITHESDWLLFLTSKQSISTFFKDIFVPFNCVFIVAVQGERTVEIFEIYRVRREMPIVTTSVGSWSKEESSRLTYSKEILWDRRRDLQGIQITAVTIQDPPITEVIKDGDSYRVSGYLGRIWDILQQELNFTTRFKYSIDDAWGSLTKDGEWNGMIGMILRNEVELGVAEFTITELRQRVVDFTLPILLTRYRIFLEKPVKADLSWNNFLLPFKWDLWMAIGAQLILQPIILTSLYVCGRNMGYEKQDDPQEYSLYNSILYIYGAFCQQGHEVTPQSTAARTVYVVTYLTAVVLYAAYSASLISYLAVHQLELPFHSLREMLQQSTYQLGVLDGSSDYTMFEKSTDPLMLALFNKLMLPNPDNFPTSVLAGLERACRMKFAFMTAYEVGKSVAQEASCPIVDVPKDYFVSSLGVAVSKGSHYLQLLNRYIKLFEESGVINRLRSISWPPEKTLPSDGTPSVSFEDILPIFVVFLFGLTVSFLLLVIEKVLKNLHRRRKSRFFPRTRKKIRKRAVFIHWHEVW